MSTERKREKRKFMGFGYDYFGWFGHDGYTTGFLSVMITTMYSLVQDLDLTSINVLCCGYACSNINCTKLDLAS